MGLKTQELVLTQYGGQEERRSDITSMLRKSRNCTNYKNERNLRMHTFGKMCLCSNLGYNEL